MRAVIVLQSAIKAKLVELGAYVGKWQLHF